IGRGASAVIWNLETGQELKVIPLSGKPVALKFAPDGERFAALFQMGEEWMIAVHDLADGTKAASHMLTNRTRYLDWHPSGRWLVVPDFIGAIHLMDAQTGETSVLGR